MGEYKLLASPDEAAWLESEKTVEKSQRKYAHFDCRTDISKCRDYITNRNNIQSHGFYPFIHYVKYVKKFSTKTGIKKKCRDICYASHIDRCIFQFYNYKLNALYNTECKSLGIDDVAIAYRTNLKGRTNIDFAKRAVDFLRQNRACYVMIGDFTGFFDNLDHSYLKKMWRMLLSNPNNLPDDHYAVFKAITRYGYIELDDLLDFHGLEHTAKGRRELNRMGRVFTPKEFRANAGRIHANSGCGIPQGSPISGVLANIYMLEVDQVLRDQVLSQNGLYMRYSDDFIIILPELDEEEATKAFANFKGIFDANVYPGLKLEPGKTQYYRYRDEQLENCGALVCADADVSNRFLNFLGFTFDGKNVSIRSKTISKFYGGMRQKGKTIATGNGFTKKRRRISAKNLYKKYSVKGARYKDPTATYKDGNFLTYVYRARNKFRNEARIGVLIKRNMGKVRKFRTKNYLKKVRTAQSSRRPKSGDLG